MLSARVSRVGQEQDGSLSRQTVRLQKAALHEAMRSQQSSVNKLPRLNEKRKGMKQPLGLSKEQAVDSGFIEDPNQLVRFGFE